MKMKMKRKVRTIALALLCVMLVIVSACSGGNNEKEGSGNNGSTSQTNGSNGSDPSNQPEITLTVFSTQANYAGEQPGWYAKVLKDKFNIKLNIISTILAGGEQKIATQMASGDLGDLIVGLGGRHYTDAIKSGLLLDWTKDGLVDKYGPHLKEYAGTALDANKQQYGGGTSIYGVGNDIGSGDGPSEGEGMVYGPMMRWDLYQQAGSPTIDNLEDYLPVLKKMQELQPKSDSGKPTYGISLWSEWDGNYVTLAKVIGQMHGYQEGDTFNNSDMILTKADEAKYQEMLDEDGYYMKGLNFYYQANQMGLLDPDSLAQTFNDVANKINDGQVFWSQFPWLSSSYNTAAHTSEGKGFQYVPFSEQKVRSYGFNPYGKERIWSIGAHTKHPERVMQFLDWLFSPEGIMETNVGPKGLIWDLDSNGKPTLTEFGYDAVKDSVNMPEEYGGGLYKDGKNQMGNSTIWLTMVNPENGEPYDYRVWTSYLNKDADPVTKSWREAMGAISQKEYVVKHNLLAVDKPFFNGEAPIPKPADLQQMHSQVGKVIKEYSWKMIYAKNDAEYNRLKDEMLVKAKGLGYDEIVKWEVEQYNKTVATLFK